MQLPSRQKVREMWYKYAVKPGNWIARFITSDLFEKILKLLGILAVITIAILWRP